MDREKVIKALEYCVLSDDCRPCEYWMEFDDKGCQIMKDALALLKKQEAQKFLVDESGKVTPLPVVVRCNDCQHGSLYCTEDVCGETLIECNRPDLGDVIEIHRWNWFCADGERQKGR